MGPATIPSATSNMAAKSPLVHVVVRTQPMGEIVAGRWASAASGVSSAYLHTCPGVAVIGLGRPQSISGTAPGGRADDPREG